MALTLKKRSHTANEPKTETADPAPQPPAPNKETPPKKNIQLRAHLSNENAQSIHDGPEVLSGEALKLKRQEKEKAAKKAALKNKEAGIIEWIALFAITIPLTYFLWTQSRGNINTAHLTTYTKIRLPVLTIAWIATIIQAFKVTRLSGFMTLLFIPYWAYFLLTEVDNKILRGIVTGLLIVTMVEMVYIPKHAFFTTAQKDFNQVIAKVQGTLSSDEAYNIR